MREVKKALAAAQKQNNAMDFLFLCVLYGFCSF